LSNLIQHGPTLKNGNEDEAIDLRNVPGSRLTLRGNYRGLYNGPVSPYDNPPDLHPNKSTTTLVTPELDILSIAAPGSNHLRCVGASRPRRDSHDQRVIEEFHSQTGQAGIMQNHERDFSEYQRCCTDLGRWTNA